MIIACSACPARPACISVHLLACNSLLAADIVIKPCSQQQDAGHANKVDKYACWHDQGCGACADPGQPAVRRTKQGTYVLAMVDGQRKLLMQGAPKLPFSSLAVPNLFLTCSADTEPSCFWAAPSCCDTYLAATSRKSSAAAVSLP